MLAQQVDNHGNKSETPEIQVSLVGRVLNVSSATRKSPHERIVGVADLCRSWCSQRLSGGLLP
jgi:hypothetical protein